MTVPAVLRRRFEEWRPYVSDVRERVEGTLIPYARKAGYVFEGRSKTLESLAEKLRIGPVQPMGADRGPVRVHYSGSSA